MKVTTLTMKKDAGRNEENNWRHTSGVFICPEVTRVLNFPKVLESLQKWTRGIHMKYSQYQYITLKKRGIIWNKHFILSHLSVSITDLERSYTIYFSQIYEFKN
jgi:hypothetical protein